MYTPPHFVSLLFKVRFISRLLSVLYASLPRYCHSHLRPVYIFRFHPFACIPAQLLPHPHTDAKVRTMLLVVATYVALPATLSLFIHQVRNQYPPTHLANPG
jgi:hypothetical protein